MCGIAGFFKRRPNDNVDLLKSMIGQVSHRGPDGYGLYLDKNAGIAHARLSIIDLEGGAQPIHNEDKTIWVTFNGEIFNYVELRKILERDGHKFYTNTDTEVIVHAYEQWGINFPSFLNGQFAIGLWDSKKKEAILVRDRVGIQPLFYTERNNTIYFASEIKSLLTIPGINKELDDLGIAETFTFWTTIPKTGRTVFLGISELPPGHLYQIRSNRMNCTKQYWDHSYQYNESMKLNDCEYFEQFTNLLNDSVKIRLRSDVPVAAYLSGGLDSTTIASIIKQQKLVSDLRTFSIEFDDGQFDESAYQKEVVDYLGVNHTSFTCSKQDVVENFLGAIMHTEKPILRTAPIPMMILSRLVKQSGYSVVLTGEGADETLAGYDIFRENAVRRILVDYPERAKELISQLYPWMGDRMTSSVSYLQQFLNVGDVSTSYFSHEPRWKTTSKSHSFFSDKMKNAAKWIDYKSAGCYVPVNNPLEMAQYVEFNTLFAGYLISSQGDRMVMANSVEGRYPFLDPKLIDFTNNLPSQLKLKDMTEKYILKETMMGKIPHSIYKRKKQPYMAPDAACFFNNNTPGYVDHLLSIDVLKQYGYFNPIKTQILRKKFEKGIGKSFADNMSFVGILSTQALHYLFIETFRPKSTPADDEFNVMVLTDV